MIRVFSTCLFSKSINGKTKRPFHCWKAFNKFKGVWSIFQRMDIKLDVNGGRYWISFQKVLDLYSPFNHVNLMLNKSEFYSIRCLFVLSGCLDTITRRLIKDAIMTIILLAIWGYLIRSIWMFTASNPVIMEHEFSHAYKGFSPVTH
jgi:hypothetical protein